MDTVKIFLVTLVLCGLSIFGVVSQNTTYVITKDQKGVFIFNIKSGITSSNTLQGAINHIKTDANGADCTIQFGDNDSPLDMGGGSISLINFNGRVAPGWGIITLTGKAISTCKTSNGVIHLEEGVSVDCNADFTLIDNNRDQYMFANFGNGTLTISGGSIFSSGSVIYNYSTGAVVINGSTLFAKSGITVFNNSSGKVTVSGNALISSENITSPGGAIYLNNEGEYTTACRLEISGGTVENTSNYYGRAVVNDSPGTIEISGGTISTTTGSAIYNGAGVVNISGGAISSIIGSAVYNSTGVVNISGGKVSSTNNCAVYIYSSGKVTVSDTALVKSSNTDINATNRGTIYLYRMGATTTTRLTIDGGTVENTSTGSTIYNYSPGSVEIKGGKILAKEGFALNNSSTGAVSINDKAILFAYGSAYTDVIDGSFTQNSDAIMVAWDKPENTAVYEEGSSDAIVVHPATAKAVWRKDGDKTGILATNGTTTSFIPVEGVEVKQSSSKGIENFESQTLNVYSNNNTLFIKGLNAGDSFHIYDLSGRSIYQGIAGAETVSIPITVRGFYVVISGEKRIKAAV